VIALTLTLAAGELHDLVVDVLPHLLLLLTACHRWLTGADLIAT
jgi:hypothetical protein